MYSQIAFGLILLGIFSILENIKHAQKFSLLGYLMILVILSITIASCLDFLTEFGYQLQIYKDIVRIISALLTINFFFIIFAKKIPKLVIGLEVFFILLFIIWLGAEWCPRVGVMTATAVVFYIVNMIQVF